MTWRKSRVFTQKTEKETASPGSSAWGLHGPEISGGSGKMRVRAKAPPPQRRKYLQVVKRHTGHLDYVAHHGAMSVSRLMALRALVSKLGSRRDQGGLLDVMED